MNDMIHFRGFSLSLALTLTLAAGAVCAAAPQAQLESLVATRQIDFATVDPLYRESMMRDGSLDEVLAQLQAMSKESVRSRRERSNALLIVSHLQWRFGLRQDAQNTIEEALKIETSADLALQQARLLEAAGELQQSQRWYDQAFALTSDKTRKENIRLRMTFVAVGQQNIEALVRLAQSRDRDFRNRAAVALAVLSHYDEAAGLYQVYGEGSDRFRQHLRLAQWALEAGDASGAQEEAWKAVQVATLDRDQRYALSVLVDAYEKDNTLEKLLQRFERKGKLSADEQDIRIDLLQKLGRYDEAIRLFNESGRTDITPASRRQLLRMYSDAGQTGQMVIEYKKLIAAEPEQAAWSEGLAQHLMEQSDRAGAMQVWQSFIDHNTHAGALMAGAEAMARFGFDELSVAATEKVIAVEPAATSEALLFRFELAMRRGRTAEAEAVLATMNRTLPPDAVDRVDLADAYERIKKPQEALQVMSALDSARKGGLGTDERMRMAWLYDSTGQRDKAIEVWKGLWNGQVPEAFRRLVEDRLVTLAAETGSLGDLAVELETKLAEGTATKKDSGLLIRIYTDTNDSASAIEVIREYFKSAGRDAADVESLREQANVYRALGRPKAYEAITRKLLVSDPENKVDYLQFLVLNQLESGAEATKESNEQLMQWLGQLRGTGGAAAGAEFEAGIMVLAGLEDRAIATYRNALAENPDHSDNYLLLADLLKKRGKEADAIGALQYLIETADQDDAFIVGVDGILNMKPRDKSIIEWAQRRVLERLTARDDKLYLYELLGELAEGSGDTNMYFSALENSLAYANSRRSNVLRELIVASAQKSPMNAMMGIGAAGAPDPQRNLRYSRRLVSLGEELPPEIYTDMGRAFLKMGDAENAADAFNRAVDRTGEANLVEQTGDLFMNEGFNRQASTQYQKALIADADNAAVMRKLAEVRVRQGASDEAEDLYTRALMNVLQGLTQEIEQVGQGAAPAFDTTVTYEYRENYIWLLSGFLFTLPSDPARFAMVERGFDDLLSQSMKNVSGLAPKPLAYYPRLKAYSMFVREAALRSGRTELADAMDSRLLRYFGNDTALVAELTRQRREWGLPASAVRLAAQARGSGPADVSSGDDLSFEAVLPSRMAATQALGRQDYELAIGLARYNKDQALVLTVYRDWAKAALTDTRVLTREMMSQGERALNVVSVLGDARGKLDTAGFASLSRYVIDLARGRPEYQRKLLYGGGMQRLFKGGGDDSSLLLAMEKAAGRTFMSDEELGDLLNAPAVPSQQGAMGGGTFDLAYVQNRLSGADLIDLLERAVGADEDDYARRGMIVPLTTAALSKPLNAQQSGRLLDVIRKSAQAQKTGRGFDPMNYVMQLQRGGWSAQIAPANISIVEQIDDFLATTYPKQFTAGALKIDSLIAEGREREALPLIVEVALGRGATGGNSRIMAMGMAVAIMMPMSSATSASANADMSGPVTQYLQQHAATLFGEHRAEFVALVQAKEKELGLTPATFALLMAVEDADPQSNPQRRRQWLESMAARYPDKEPVLAALARDYGSQGYVDQQIKTLERLTALAPRKVEYRKELFQLWKQLGNPVNAVASANGRIADVTQTPDSGRQAMRSAMRNQSALQRPVVAGPVEQVVALENGGSADEARLGLRSLLHQLPPAGGGYDAMRMQYAELFGLDWQVPEPAREAAADEDEDELDDFFMPSGRRSAVPTIEALSRDEKTRNPYTRDEKFLDKLTDYEFSIAEFEAQIRTLRPQDIDDEYLMYALLADAYDKHGRLQQVLSGLTAKVQTGAASGKERVLWLELLCRASQVDAAAQLPLVEKTVGAVGGVDGYEQLLLARLYAHAGNQTRAADIYAATVMSGGLDIRRMYGESAPTLLTVSGLYVDASEHLGAAALDRFAGMLLQIVQPPNEVAAAAGVYEQFVVWMLEQTPQSPVLQAQVQTLINAAAASGKWSPETYLQAATLLARRGEHETALKMLALSLREPVAAAQANPDDPALALQQQLVQSYQAALSRQSGAASMLSMGRMARGSSGLSVMSFKSVFPSSADEWPRAQEWTQLAGERLAGLIGQGAVAREMALQVLALVTLRQHQMGANDAVSASAHRLAELLAPYDSVTQPTATLVIAVLEHTQAPIDVAMLRGLIEQRRIDVRLIGPALRRVENADGAAQAFALGQLAVAYSQEPNLLQTMKKLADAAGKPELVQVYIDLEKKSAQAREVLASGKDVKTAAAAAEALNTGESGSGPAIGEGLELKFTAVDGRAVDLAQLKGKVVLVDFWATWCGPCIAELPNLKRTYETWNARGFEVIGISLDRSNDEEKLKDFVAKNNMPWPQHFDGKYWKNEIAVKNGINAIPAAWLFDQEGKLVTKNARGKTLEEEVARLLGQTTASTK